MCRNVLRMLFECGIWAGCGGPAFLPLPPVSVLVAHLHTVPTPSLFSSHPALICAGQNLPSLPPFLSHFKLLLYSPCPQPLYPLWLLLLLCTHKCLCMCVCVCVLTHASDCSAHHKLNSPTESRITEPTHSGTFVRKQLSDWTSVSRYVAKYFSMRSC